MVYKALADLLFPATCLVCGDSGAAGLDLCQSCSAELAANSPACRCCALPLPPGTPDGSLCGRCGHQPPPFDRIIAPWLYRPPLTTMIQQLKFAHKLPAGRLLGQLLARQVPGPERPQLLLPVPQHGIQLRQRGFNHAAEITRETANHLQIPWSPWTLLKMRPTPSQHGLNRKRRQNNLRGCFTFSENANVHHVAVIDDVVTTAATVAEIARTLKRAGVEQVEIWAVARTPLEP